MAELGYVFNDVNIKRELQRLRAIEKVFDPASRRRLEAAGIRKGSRCLEVGPGAGSILHWMVREVGSSGYVTAVEANPRFLKGSKSFELIHGDLLETSLGQGSFHLVHARYVLIHITEYRRALKKMIQALKPGGWIVLEEPDFTFAKPVNGTDEEMRSVQRVNRAIELLKGTNPGFGVRLPALIEERGLSEIKIEVDVPLVRGGMGVAEVMAQSAEQLSERYSAAGHASSQDVRSYIQYCRNPKRWAVYYATVAVSARKPK